ncbi:MAG: carbamoyl-phosphate synthase large subunit, partial [Pseudomonadota bacterium]
MPRRCDLDTIIVLGAGPILIGQACEFDYSGTQALKALRQDGYRTVLLNSNPATIMTDPDLADATYIEPVTKEYAHRVLMLERKQHPNERMALLPTMGGQTALNVALELEKDGVLTDLEIELIGARADAIQKAEDRECFRQAMDAIGLESPRSTMVRSIEEARHALDMIGLPAILRPSFTLGGTGGGIATTREAYFTLVEQGLRASPSNSVLIEESVLGWKEFEMEVVRDQADNCIIVCSIENLDPMGIHTGDSITVAPALTLSDREYQRMRNASIAVLRTIGVDTGGSNVQFAVNPDDGRMVVIEMNPRVSRSSALASKATGFPIAKVAARLATGYLLNELANDITKVTPASFEPSIDYIVTKIPYFTFEKFPGASTELSTAMKSVGEIMAIGRSFRESLQKGLRSLEAGWCGLNEPKISADDASFEDDSFDNDRARLMEHVGSRRPGRILYVAAALRAGFSVDEVYEACKIDRWFLREIEAIILIEADLQRKGLPESADACGRLKSMGFSDERLGQLTGCSTDSVTQTRLRLGVTPIYKRIDSCAGEFQSEPNYFYSSYAMNGYAMNGYAASGYARGENESIPSTRRKIAILGSGPNRIGQGIEFDYCCVHAAYALKEAGYETIMINCNPETVSTDYDTSDRLYFEPLVAEDVIAVLTHEAAAGRLHGVVVQFGGQTPLKLAHALQQAGIPILGTPVDSIDLAEDRERFRELLLRLGMRQPESAIATSREEAIHSARQLGYPIVIRPSYVLGGRAMEIVHDEDELVHYIDHAVQVSGQSPVLIDRYLSGAIELDVDALCDGQETVIAGILEHVEEAGIHSGDSACTLPPQTLSDAIIASLTQQTKVLANAL